MSSDVHFTSALLDFQRARRRAAIQSIVGRLTGKRGDLLSYEDVRKQLKAIEGADRQLQDIPLDSIIGSVNRYTDFNRDFLPKRGITAERWARVKAAAQGMLGLPPIEVYKIGDVYFVQDGNHRVSIAKQQGAQYIQAYVKDVYTRLPVTQDIQPSDLIIKAELTSFLEQTNLDKLRPQCNLTATNPGSYQFLMQQIEAVRFAHEIKKNKEIPYHEAVVYWYDQIYIPTIEVIREFNLLSDYSNRTETDLFVWIVKYQSELKKSLGWNISKESAALNLESKFRPTIIQTWLKYVQVFIPKWLRKEPEAGKWRKQQLFLRQGRIFEKILIVFYEPDLRWNALDFGLKIAQYEGAEVFGLCISHPKQTISNDKKNEITTLFDSRCKHAEVPGELVFAVTSHPERIILSRDRWANLLILPFTHRAYPIRSSNISLLARQSSNPVLCIPYQAKPPFKRILLAYNDSPKSNEALFLATYAAKFWELSLVVLSVLRKGQITQKMIIKAYNYLEKYGVSGDFIKAEGPPATAITTFAVEDNCDLILIGGYGRKKMEKILNRSLVDKLLRNENHLLLICK